jgi:hypothetical protein
MIEEEERDQSAVYRRIRSMKKINQQLYVVLFMRPPWLHFTSMAQSTKALTHNTQTGDKVSE